LFIPLITRKKKSHSPWQTDH